MNLPTTIARRIAATALAAVAFSTLALAVATSRDTNVTFISGAQTQAAFAKGRPLIETAEYKVHASRREAPGMAEVHALDTDIIYVLDGTATLVTGGKMVGASEVAPHEVRGHAVEGGRPQRLARGDVFVVPNGVPHWFTDVQPPFLYYVVKTTAGGAR